MDRDNEFEYRRRWRLILGGGEADEIDRGESPCDGNGKGDRGADVELDPTDRIVDRAMESLYGSERYGGLGSSSPNLARWLGDIRTYFPTSTARILQQDAIDRLDLHHLLLEPEMLSAMEPDVRLAADLLSLDRVMPHTTKDTARKVIAEVVLALARQLTAPTTAAVRSARGRSIRNFRPRHGELDWQQTIRANLKYYQPEYRTIVPVARIGRTPSKSSLPEIILCIDGSGSMATSVVYASIFGAVLASIDSIDTYLVGFDTSIVDFTDRLQDPIEVLFGMQLGGGTDIDGALVYCQGLIRTPHQTILVLISDLYEGGDPELMLRRVAQLTEMGVQVVVLLALNDEGAPDFDRQNAQRISDLGIPVFACTPDRFPDLMGAALNGQNLDRWIDRQDG
ncbi:VWA domain-containing protein [Oscillatoriales cyanobacterium LEGE 11467]|uniref:VWA domain-containing protein n=1 Tax=Zarconia navalis LEGE 11467 TaxID=1828826 RepID=A0A928VYC6_9CYAN|nr:VWA domain-containing protein [Zarconia navalis]MBE9040010.1 VWA domain-containing protein [Zarconia navalis LEGE 11467]